MINRLARLTTLRFSLVFAAAMMVTILIAIGATGVTAAVSSAVSIQGARDDVLLNHDAETTDVDLEESGEAEPPGSTPVPSPSDIAPSTLAPLPRSCEDIYSPQMRATLASNAVQLNPVQTGGGVTGIAYSDPVIDETIRSIPSLRCFWGDPGSQTAFVMETRIAAVTAEQAIEVQNRLAAIGYTPIQELGGTRYYFDDGVDYYGAPFGESHIVVGGYWFATAWSLVGIRGYTADMVQSVLG